MILLFTLQNEAESLLDKAKEYRKVMDELPDDDSRRQVYYQIILDLLERSRRFSNIVDASV